MDIKILAGVLKRIGHFSMDEFSDRLNLQKHVYFLQVFGINLGYRFTWYLFGPYSPSLAKDGFELVDKPINININFSKHGEEKFESFLHFLGEEKQNSEWFEILASLHFLNKVFTDKSKKEIIEMVKKKHGGAFDQERCEEAWEYLDKFDLM